MASTAALAKEFFTANQNKDYVANTDLHRYIRERNKQSRAVLNGTLDGTGAGSLISFPWYTDMWCKEKLSNGRIVHKKHGKTMLGAVEQREMDYVTEEKRLAAEKIMSYLPTTGKHNILTLASISGNCVQTAVARNPNISIDNIEMDPQVLAIWKMKKKKLGVETQDFTCMLQEFVEAPGFADKQYTIFNADVMGYASEPMMRYLRVVNKLQNCEFVAITTQRLDNFRNTGKFIEALRAKYAGQDDKHAKCIADWMFNYTMIDRFVYRKDVGTREMEVFIFQRGDL